MKKTSKRRNVLSVISTIMFVMMVGLFLVSCGASTDSDTASGRLLSGEINTTATPALNKSLATKSEQDVCIDEICGVIATSSSGQAIEGEVYKEDNAWMWKIRLTAGSWKIGFYDSESKLLGYFEVNGITEFTLDEGEDINFGRVRFVDGRIVAEEDIEGLGERGFRSSDDFDEDYDPNIFSIIKVKPENGHTYVAPCRPIKIKLSQSIDQTTMNENTILVKNSLNELIPGTFTYEEEVETEDDGEVEAEYEIKFKPTNNFGLDSTITVSVLASSDGLLNSIGEPLDKNYSWSFTTRDFGEAAAKCHDSDDEYGEHMERERERHGDDDAEEDSEQNEDDD